MGNSFVLFYLRYPWKFPEANSLWENQSHTKSCHPVGNSHLPMGKTASVILPVISLQHVMSTGCSASFWLTVTKIRVCYFCLVYIMENLFSLFVWQGVKFWKCDWVFYIGYQKRLAEVINLFTLGNFAEKHLWSCMY